MKNLLSDKRFFELAAFLVISFMYGCESLEDTYKDYSGNGTIRYVGKVTDLSYASGWKHINLNWTNSVDPIIDRMLVVWSHDDMRDSAYLEAKTDHYDITDLDDYNYEISVYSVDMNGNRSIASTIYARPYTYSHESVQSFTGVVSQYYFYRNHLILSFLGWEDNIAEASLEYYSKEGEKRILPLTPEIVNQYYYVVPEEVDADQPVVLNRSGYIEGCDDLIQFELTELDSDTRYWSSDFKSAMKRQFGFVNDIPQEFADTTRVVYFDWGINSFMDLFYMNSLEKVVLGKGRYIHQNMLGKDGTQSAVYDTESALFALKTLNELGGVEVERYNQQYPTLTSQNLPSLKEMGTSSLPDYEYLDLTGKKFTSVPADDEYFSSYLEYLTDGDITSIWNPLMSNSAQTFILTLDLGEKKHVNGIVLNQAYYNAFNVRERATCPSSVKIYTAQEDGASFTSSTYVEELEIGSSTGEANDIPLADGGTDCNFIQLQLTTPSYAGSYFKISLAEVRIY